MTNGRSQRRASSPRFNVPFRDRADLALMLTAMVATMIRVDMNKINKNLDDVRFNRSKRRMTGRKRMGRPSSDDNPRSPVDFDRVCEALGFGEVPPNMTETSLIDLWNNYTDYYLPRLEDKKHALKFISKPMKDRNQEVELWREVGILS